MPEILEESDDQVVISDDINIVLYIRVYEFVLEPHIVKSLSVKSLLQQVKTALQHLPVIRKADSRDRLSHFVLQKVICEFLFQD